MRQLKIEPLEPRIVLDSTVVFSELMYNPGSNQNLEWIELFNEMAIDMDISNWKIEGIGFTFPPSTVIAAQQFIVVAISPDQFEAAHNVTADFGPYAGRLNNGGESIQLVNNNDRVMDELAYDDQTPWPVAADGSGATLVKRNLGGGSRDVSNWTHSRVVGGTPGTASVDHDNPRPVVFSEIARRDSGEFFIELANVSTEPVDLRGYSFRGDQSDDEHALSGTLSPGGHAVINRADLSFPAELVDELFLFANDSTRVEDAVRLGDAPQAKLHFGEFANQWLTPTNLTPGELNAVDFETEVVINEIFYHAPGTAVDDQPATFETTLLLPIDDQTTWRYRADALGLASGWADAVHVVGEQNWQSGTGLFGHEGTPLGIPIRTEFPNPATIFPPITTFYFETDFSLDATQLASNEGIALRHMIDDGAVFFMNGQEFLRYNMPEGEFDSGTFATSVPNAVFSETISIPKELLRAGNNRLSVEVHQASVASNDVVFGAEILQTKLLTASIPGQPYTESEEEWIEIHNRHASRTIDVAGWQFDDGVRFTFPEQTQIGPGEYRLIVWDVEEFSQKYPDKSGLVVGSFEGQLSNGGETIRLVDASGNPADEVRYYDGGRWSPYADGGGVSLELISPFADNRSPESWAASDETAESEWQTISYEGVVTSDGFSGNVSTRYHEFILGLLDGGEVLIDDVSVLENGVGGIERIQNGTFESDALGGMADRWRIGGNHSGIVVLDPDDANNQVLKLITTGSLEDRYNHAETTFAGNAQIREGTNYRISFRARWLTGSNQVNSHLYFDRLQRTTRLTRPETPGTLGERNSNYQENTGPVFTNLSHSPTLPNEGQEVTVTVSASDRDDIDEVVLFYAVEDGEFQSTPMQEVGLTNLSNRQFAATIPGQSAGDVINFYVQGRDRRGAFAQFPNGGENSRALYQIPEQDAREGIHNFRMIMKPSEVRLLHDRTNVLSNGRLGATLIYNESEVFYDVGVRLKGSNAGRSDASYLGFNVQFDPMQLFRGIHESVAIDRSGRSGPTPRTQDEILIKHVGNAAGGIPYMYDDLVHVIAPRRAYTRTALLMMARYGDEFLDSQFENGADGTLFKLDIAYVPNGTTNGDPESPKVAFPYSHPQPSRDLQDLGDDKEAYRSHLLIRNNRDRDDYSRIIEASKILSQRGDSLVDQATEVIDIDQWARTFALQSLSGAADVYTRGGLHHNIEFYVRPSDHRVIALPWDWDFAFTASPNQALIGTAGTGGRLMSQPGVRRLYHGHLLDLINTTFNNEYLDSWIDHYGEVANQNLSRIKTYVQQRRDFVLERLPDKTDFLITTNDGVRFETKQPIVKISGEGWIDVREIRIGAQPVEGAAPLTVNWLDDSRWEVELQLDFGSHDLRLVALNHHGEVVGEDSIAITSTLGDLNENQLLDVMDIDLLSVALRAGDTATGDLNDDGEVNQADHAYLIQDRFKTNYGDANLDGVFDSTDLVLIFRAAQFEDGIPGNSNWADGDWNGDGDFTTLDLVFAFQSGAYETGE